MTVGMVLDNRYKVTAKLGWGVSSTVWEAEDLQDNHKLCALKIVKSAEQYTEAAKDEIQMMKKLTENDPEGKSFCIRLLNTFEVTSKNGTRIFVSLKSKRYYSFLKNSAKKVAAQ